jgi:hypothetical protein
MKLPIKDDKCKKEFALWEDCYKNTYFSEFKKIEKDKKISIEEKVITTSKAPSIQ